jgi:HTH-type transcriptional regulator/antitoxin HigA
MVKAKKKHGFDPDYAIPPGETLLEFIESRAMKKEELALRTDLTVMSLNRIFKGEQPITYETASRLELVTDMPASFWNNLESNYRERLTRIKEKEQLAEDLQWLKQIPVSELIRRGIIEPADDQVELLRQVLGFFGVSSVEAWRNLWLNPEFAARRSECFETLPGPTAAWLRLGELESLRIRTEPYNRSRFIEGLKRIRSLTRVKPDEFLPRMRKLCADAGVALSLIPEMKKVPWSGASKWISPDKAMILLSLRGKSEDRFWFSFFHEAGHILKGSKLKLYISDEKYRDEDERVADKFAANMLIPAKYNEQIASFTSYDEIREFADRIGISPGIVAGRYQYLTGQWNYFKKVQRKFKWAPDDSD